MANPYPAVFRDDNSDTRLAGAIDFTDVANQPGGYIPVRSVGQVFLSAAGVAVAGGAQTTISWAVDQGDATMIDLSTPTLPAPVAAGTYAYVLMVIQQGGGSGDPFLATLSADQDFYTPTVTGSAQGLASGQAYVLVPLTWFGTALSAFTAFISNGGAGGHSDTFNATIFIQRIT